MMGFSWLLACIVAAQLQPPRPLVATGWPTPDLPSVQLADFWYPLERNPERRLPSLEAGLTSVQMLEDGLRGWAVGESGTVLATNDGGETWMAQGSPTAHRLRSVYFASDGEHGWAVGEQGTVIATTDGGKSWSAQSSTTQETLHAVQFAADGELGWAVGDNGAVILTVDAGRSWAAQKSATQVNLSAVRFMADGQLGWALGSTDTSDSSTSPPQQESKIIATADGGRDWLVQSTVAGAALTSLYFADIRRGWAVGKQGAVYASIDGGKSWTRQSSPTRADLHSVYFAANAERGVAVGEDGAAITTVGGGKRWVAPARPAITTLQSVYLAADGQRGWAVGEHGTVVATTDGGKSWFAQTRPAAPTLSSVHFAADGLHGWASGYDTEHRGRLIATVDGGSTWVAQRIPAMSALMALHFTADGERAWAVGLGLDALPDGGKVMTTADGGHTWLRQSAAVPAGLISTYFTDDGLHGWAVASNGGVIATDNGGNTWVMQNSPATLALHAISFAADGKRGLAVGSASKVITTADGGNTWLAQKLPQVSDEANLLSLHLAADGLHGWVAGELEEAGCVLATVDGGKSWEMQSTPATRGLHALHFSADNLHGWAAGEDGAVLATNDGGKSWTKQASPTRSTLYAVDVEADGLRGWAVGADGAVIATADGGALWASPLPYRRFPAPWFWPAILPSFAMLVMAYRSRRVARGRDSVADVGASDAAIERPQDDVLDFVPLARGISRFLRNEQTSTPLTLAITGDWGAGKSSLMHLLGADLKHYGYRPIWFNAWHYQKEAHLFAALLSTIRTQLAPSIWTLAGLSFRLRLLWLRSKKSWAWALLLTTAATAVVTWLLVHPSNQWYALGAWMRKLARIFNVLQQLVSTAEPTGSPADELQGAADHGQDVPWAALLAQLGTAAAVLVGLRRGMTAIGADPAALLAGVAKSFTLRTATAQSTLRVRFAEQFADVARALPHRMVIVIDDLDRCKPEAVLEVVEAVNFLTSAGDCYVVFGMATERVQAALGIAFERIARELADAELGAAAISDEGKENAEREKRRAYARDYMEKLINIEIKVPTRRELEAHRLLTAHTRTREPRKSVHGLRAVAASLPLLLAGAAVVLGISIGLWPAATTGGAPYAQTETSVPLGAATDAERGGPRAPGVTPGTGEDLLANPHAATSILPGESSSASLYWGLLPLALALLLLFALAVQRLRQQAIQVQDSKDFREALQVWTPLVALKHNTPRTVKRFGNRIRYLAMLQQGAMQDLTLWQQLLEQLESARRAFSGQIASRPDLPRVDALAEPQLIALGAIHEVFGAGWRQAVSASTGEAGDYQRFLLRLPAILQEHPELAGHQKFLARLPNLIEEHREQFGSPWPPLPREMDVFERLLAGVRLPGVTQIITASARKALPRPTPPPARPTATRPNPPVPPSPTITHSTPPPTARPSPPVVPQADTGVKDSVLKKS